MTIMQPSLPVYKQGLQRARGRVGGMALIGYACRQVKLGAQAPGKQVLSSTTEVAAVYMITVPYARQYLWARRIMGGMQEWGGFMNLVKVPLRKSRRAWAL